MNQQDVHLSKLLSLILRHKPDIIGVSLDDAGWVEVSVLLEGLHRIGKGVDREDIERVVRENDKQRFVFSEDGLKIRASQGHSIVVDLGLKEKQPPEWLYHGTSHKAITQILHQGLSKRKRQFVHLSENIDTAAAVGCRYGWPVILHIEAGAMHKDGYSFYQSENNVWLTDSVPPHYLQVINDMKRLTDTSD